MSLPFLLEIGVEEVPDWMIVPALQNLRELIGKFFEENKLSGVVDWVDATPRRLALQASGLIAQQPDAEELVTGPPKSAGVGAAAGFAKKNGTTLDQLSTEVTPKGEYFAFRRKVLGRQTADLLAESLPGIIAKIYFPKTMYWTGKGGPRFIRPIRWIVALLDDVVVPFEFAGVKSGSVTQGHRRLGSSSLPVRIATYAEQLRKNFVILHAEERRRRIESQIAELPLPKGSSVQADPKLLETLAYLTEWPTPIVGSFAREYLTLPREVLSTVMRHHQKYFSVDDADGKLANAFVAVTNIESDAEGIVRHGNERVIRARFNDARFFWDVDQQKPLAARVNDLANVTFQAKLGSYLEKTKRVVELVRELGGDGDAQRAALLAKADLTTEMVKEFTDLQGVIGGLYAGVQNEPKAVADAIYEHYKPLSMEDSIPSTPAGRFLSLADKLDTLRGCFGIGMIPSGSKDPFALRRAAQGVVKILVEGRMPLALWNLLGSSEELKTFFEDRVKYYFKDVRGFAYDEVNAAMAVGWSDLVDLDARLERIHAIRPTPDFEPLAASFKRIKNILRQASFSGGAALSEELLEAGPERELYDAFRALSGQPIESAIGALRPKVDQFFDRILVNAPDPKVRENRLALLHGLFTEFSTIADFSEIVTQ